MARRSKLLDPINLFVPKFRVEECLAEIRECLEAGWTGLGFKTVQMEQKWIAYTDLPHAHFINSATSGLHLAVRLLKDVDGWTEGDEIISTALTFVSTNHAIKYEGLNPVFADVDEYLCLDPEAVRLAITPRTRAIMFVGMGGNTGQLSEIIKICQEHDLRLILDAAHMAGTRLDGQHVGQGADVTVFSFQAVKNLPTADAGMICFESATLDEEVRKWTWLGINKDTYTRTVSENRYRWHYDVENVGYKYHGNSVMAALALVGLRYLDEDNAQRRNIASRYRSMLSKSANLSLVSIPEGCVSSQHLFQIMTDNRDEVMDQLNQRDIFPGVHYKDNASYRMYADLQGSCPRAHRASERLISLPLHVSMTEQDASYVAQSLLEIVEA